MNGGGGGQDPPLLPLPINSGEFLLRLVQNSPHTQPPDTFLSSTSAEQRNTHCVSVDPAIAAVGPSIPLPINNPHDRPLTPHHPWPPTLSPPNNNNNSFSPPYPRNLFRHGFPHNPSSVPHHQSPPPPTSNISLPQQQINVFQQQQQQRRPQEHNFVFGNLPIQNLNERDNSAPRIDFRDRESGFVSGNRTTNQYESPWSIDPRMNSERYRHSGNGVYGSPDMRRSGPPPGFSGTSVNRGRSFEHNVVTEIRGRASELNNRDSRFSSNKDYEDERRFASETGSSSGSSKIGLSGQLDRPGLPAGTTLHSVSASDIEQSLLNLHAAVADDGKAGEHRKLDNSQHDSNGHDGFPDEIDDLGEQLVESLIVEDGPEEKKDKKKHHRDKDFRSDARGQRILPQRMRNFKRFVECRNDIDMLNAPFLAIYDSLIPAVEEKAKQRQLLTLLEKLVRAEWPNARLYLYGSCANSFGVSKSDIDVCLAIDDKDTSKSEILLRLAEILQSDNLQDVQALTRARVPIVKLKDPVTEISCDICINNVLAVVNTKLLRDYAEIDIRLRQLAYIVKHWAKSRGVNETYQGTLSSYAYVLMCIHFLQQRRPAILPCLQGMEATYVVTVDDVKCAYFDEVKKLRHFGARNRESIAHLVWAFFNYWAYCHDYSNSVISVRTGSILSKQVKDWTRRIGNDRHLICIEDPFETSHDLGRVVDKNSIRVLREEFERAAEILQYDPNPCVKLFEPYVPR